MSHLIDRPIAVFSTSDLRLPWGDDSEHGEKPVFEGEVQGEHLKVFSSGALEAAIAAGKTIYVITTRSKLVESDQWWLKLVGQDNVLLTPNETPETAYGERLFAPWRELFLRLQLPFPEGEYQHWTQLRREIESRYPRLVLGSRFKTSP